MDIKKEINDYNRILELEAQLKTKKDEIRTKIQTQLKVGETRIIEDKIIQFKDATATRSVDYNKLAQHPEVYNSVVVVKEKKPTLYIKDRKNVKFEPLR